MLDLVGSHTWRDIVVLEMGPIFNTISMRIQGYMINLYLFSNNTNYF